MTLLPAALLALLILAACSTTRRLQDGSVLYTGVSKFDVKAP